MADLRVGVLTPDQFDLVVPQLGALLAEAVAGGAGVTFLPPFSPADGARWWAGLRPEVSEGRRLVLAAAGPEEAGPVLDVLGTVSLVPAPMPNQPHRADVVKLLVAERARRRGVATALMTAVEQEARALGRTLLTLDCVAGGPEEAFYRGIGFTKVGTIPGYALGPDRRPQGATFLYRELPPGRVRPG